MTNPEQTPQNPTDFDHRYAVEADFQAFLAGDHKKGSPGSKEMRENAFTEIYEDAVFVWADTINYGRPIDGASEVDVRTKDLHKDWGYNNGGVVNVRAEDSFGSDDDTDRYHILDFEVSGAGQVDEPAYIGSLAIREADADGELPEVRFDLDGSEDIDNWAALSPEDFFVPGPNSSAKLSTRRDRNGELHPKDVQLQALLMTLQLTAEHFAKPAALANKPKPVPVKPGALSLEGLKSRLDRFRDATA